MRGLRCVWLLAAMFLAGAPAASGQEADAAYLKGQVLATVLDPDAPMALRQESLKELEEAARKREPLALWALGALYRLGPKHPAALLPLDAEQARKFLSNAAARGAVRAMLSLAELELAAGDAEAAMVWAQLYAHYRGGPQVEGSSYVARLVHRCRNALGSRYDADAIAEDAAAFIERFDESVRKAKLGVVNDRDKPRRGTEAPDLWDEIQRQRPFPRSSPYLEGDVTFLALWNEDGRVDRLLVLDAVPGVDVAKAAGKVGKKPRVAKPSESSDWDLLYFLVVAPGYELR